MDTRNKTKNKPFFSKLFVVIVILLICFFVIGIFREYSKRREIDNELQDLKKELTQLQEQKDNFLNLLDMYESDFFIEQEARTKFNYQKAGEKVVVIDEVNSNLKLVEQNNNEEKKQENILISRNLVAWWDYFFAEQKFN